LRLGHLDDCELVSADARHQIITADGGREQSSSLLEGTISAGMPQSIVDGLETVEIDGEDRHDIAGPLTARKLVSKTVFEKQPICQPSEHVVIGEELCATLGSTATLDGVAIVIQPTS
jgi:hypothetical protein